MTTNVIARLTKQQFQLLQVGLLIGIFAITYIFFRDLLRNYQIPLISPAFLVIVPLTMYRRKTRPEEFEPYNLKHF